VAAGNLLHLLLVARAAGLLLREHQLWQAAQAKQKQARQAHNQLLHLLLSVVKDKAAHSTTFLPCYIPSLHCMHWNKYMCLLHAPGRAPASVVHAMHAAAASFAAPEPHGPVSAG
jgi:hypothetical protein